MVTLCAFLLQLVLWRCQNTAHFYWCLHTFVKYVECMQHFHEWVSLDRDFAIHLNVQNRKMYAMVTLCAFLLQLVLWRCQNTAHFYWCLHTFVKYVECMQHFHEWVSLDREFGIHLNVQNRKMYAMVTLCAFLLQLVLWRCQNTAQSTNCSKNAQSVTIAYIFRFCTFRCMPNPDLMILTHESAAYTRHILQRCANTNRNVQYFDNDISIGVCTPL